MSLELTARKVTTWIVGTQIPGPAEIAPPSVEVQMTEISDDFCEQVVRSIARMMEQFNIVHVDMKLGMQNVYFERYGPNGDIEPGKVIDAK